MNKYFVFLLFTQMMTHCETTTQIPNDEVVKIPIHVSWSVEPLDKNKDRSDYIDVSEVSNIFLDYDSIN